MTLPHQYGAFVVWRRMGVGIQLKRIPNSVSLSARYPKEALCYVLGLIYHTTMERKQEMPLGL